MVGSAASQTLSDVRSWTTGRSQEIRDYRQPHHVGEALSRCAHRGMGQNHIPDGWAEAWARDCELGLPGLDPFAWV